MAKCGNCKLEGQTVGHIQECHQQKFALLTSTPVEPSGFARSYAASRDYKPMALAQEIPDSRYALDTPNGLYFYEVRTGTKGKWVGFQFVSRLIGHPGDWLKQSVKGANRAATLSLIKQDPKEAALRYSREFTRCAVCESPLSDPISMETGFGPICAKRF